MQKNHLPQVVHIDYNRSQPISNHHLRNAIHRKYDWINHSLPLPDTSLHQLIPTPTNTATRAPQRDAPFPHATAFNKKVLIFNKRANAK
jgi:hypothetical protein